MKYVALDIETTGLDPERHQILEIAAVCDDLEGETSEDVFHAYIPHREIVGDLGALVMNAGLLKVLSRGWVDDGGVVVTTKSVAAIFSRWLYRHALKRVVFAGKNVANFDLRFMRKLPDWRIIEEHHRVIDPTSYYLLPGDKEPPSLRTCLTRAGLAGAITHRAVDDARAVVSLIRRHFEERVSPGYIVTSGNFGL